MARYACPEHHPWERLMEGGMEGGRVKAGIGRDCQAFGGGYGVLQDKHERAQNWLNSKALHLSSGLSVYYVGSCWTASLMVSHTL